MYEEPVEPVPDIFLIERNFNERVSAEGIYTMQEKVSKFEKQSKDIPEMKDKIELIQRVQFDLFSERHDNDRLRKENHLVKLQCDRLEQRLQALEQAGVPPKDKEE